MSAPPLPGAPPALGARDPEGDPFAWLRRPDALLRRFVLARIFEPPRVRAPWRPRGAQAPVPLAPSPQARESQARESQARESQARESQARESQARESQARESQARESRAPARSHHQPPADPDREGGR